MQRPRIVLVAFGVLMLAAAGSLRYVVVPRTQLLAEGDDRTVTSTGSLTAADFGRLFRGRADAVSELPVTIDRTVKVVRTSGHTALVSDTSVITSSAAPVPLKYPRTTYDYAIDRSTRQAVAGFADVPTTHADGLVVGFPPGTAKRTYRGWVGQVGATQPIEFRGEARVEGLTVYRFTAALTRQLPPTAMIPELEWGMPDLVPKNALSNVAKALDLPAAEQAQLTSALAQLPEVVRLTATYTERDTYWVEPVTGVVVDMTRASRLALEFPRTPLPPVPALSIDVRYDRASVTALADRASDGRSRARLYGTALPDGLGALGLLCLAAAPMLRRRGEHDTNDAVPPTVGQSAPVASGRPGSATHSLHDPA